MERINTIRSYLREAIEAEYKSNKNALPGDIDLEPLYYYYPSEFIVGYVLHKLTGRALLRLPTPENKHPFSVAIHIGRSKVPAASFSSPIIETTILVNRKLHSLGINVYFPNYSPDEPINTLYMSEGLILNSKFYAFLNFMGRILSVKIEASPRKCTFCSRETYNISRVCNSCLRRCVNLERFGETLDPSYLKIISSRSDHFFMYRLIGLRHSEDIRRGQCLIDKRPTVGVICSYCEKEYDEEAILLDLINWRIKEEEVYQKREQYRRFL